MMPMRLLAAGTSAPANITDSFDRADSASSLGNTDTGQAWMALRGTWGIASSTARSASNADDDLAVVDRGSVDMTATVTFRTLKAAWCGLAVRCSDATHFYLAAHDGGYTLYVLVRNGGYTVLYSGACSAFNPGDALEFSIAGSAIAVRRNGSLVASLTDATLATGTKAGLRHGTSGATTYDDFSVS